MCAKSLSQVGIVGNDVDPPEESAKHIVDHIGYARAGSGAVAASGARIAAFPARRPGLGPGNRKVRSQADARVEAAIKATC